MFITLEGGEAAGKTTQIALLARRLASFGREVVVTREPGGTEGAESIRQVVKSASCAFGKVSQRLLFVAARRDLIDKVIAPALSRDAIVICDRYVHSTLAYQGGADPASWTPILEDHQRFNDNLLPTLALYLDLPVDIAAVRLTGRGVDADDLFENFPRDFRQPNPTLNGEAYG